MTQQQMPGTPEPLRCLTLHQPWGTAMGLWKHTETRSWGTPYRGLVGIHAGKTEDTLFTSVARRNGYAVPDPLPLGAIITVGRLVNCRRMVEAPSDDEAFWGNFGPGRYGWTFAELRPIAPITIRGYQALWEPPAEVAWLALTRWRMAATHINP